MDETQREWLAGDGDYLWAARKRATVQAAEPEPVPAEALDRDALLGDLGGGPSLELLDRFGRTRHVEDDSPPGLGS